MGGVLGALAGTGGSKKTSLVIGKGQFAFKSNSTTGYIYNSPVINGVIVPVGSNTLAVVGATYVFSITYYNFTNKTSVSLMNYVSTSFITKATINGTAYTLATGVQSGTSATVTMSIASPCVVTWTSHNMTAGAHVIFTTTGALPTGLLPNTVYFVRNTTTNTFELGLAPNSASSINTSGTQSGTQTGVTNPQTYFDLVTSGDFLGSANPGAAGPYPVTLTIANPCVFTFNSHGQANGQRLMLRTTGTLPTGLAINTVYYVVNTATNTFQLSLTSGGAAIATSGSQTGTHSFYQAVNIDLE
jgi:hypothetical protein